MLGLPNNADLLSPGHRRQFVDFRVVVYRLHLPDSAAFTLGDAAHTKVSLDTLFNTDFGDRLYTKISETLNRPDKPEEFSRFLNAYAQAIKSALTYNGKDADIMDNLSNVPDDAFNSSGHKDQSVPLQEIDITPLVRVVGNRLSITPANQCMLTMFDPQLTNLTDTELARFAQISRASSERLEKLKSFRFREFDLVRVFTYSDIERSATQKTADMRSKLSGGNGVFSDGLEARFYMSPMFTGLVNTVTRSNAIGQTSTLNVQLLGLQRMFMQSVSVFNEALSNILAEATPDLSTLHDNFELTDGRFAEQGADTVALKLFGDYLLPLYLKEKSTNSIMVGVPDLDNVLKRMFRKDGKALFYPMLPTIVLIHLMKKKYGEPIVTFDDRVNPKIHMISKSGDTSATVNVSPNLSTVLQPYLLRFRDSFSVFNADYQSAEQIFETIRSTTFLEVFEDRTGGFHVRFPKYNSVDNMVDINPRDVQSVSHIRTDSAIFTSDVAQLVFPIMGQSQIVDPKVFMDKLSILKFGLRRPQTAANPNAGTDKFAQALAKFNRDYFTYMDARRATIVKLGDSGLNVGQMVLFRLRKDAKADPSDLSQDGFHETYVGYILEIVEEISVGGQYVQTLQLGFVRQASQMESPKESIFTGTVWDIVNCEPSIVRGTDPAQSPVVSKMNLSSKPINERDTRGFLFSLALTGNKRRFVQASFPRVADPLDLARAACEDKGVIRLAAQAALASGKSDIQTVDKLKAGRLAIQELVDEERRTLGMVAVRAAIYKEFLPFVQGAAGTAGTTLAVNPVGGNVTSGPKSRSDMAGVVGQLESDFMRIRTRHLTTFASDISAADGSQAGTDTTIQAATGQLTSNDVAMATSFKALLNQADDTGRTDPFRSGEPPFLDRWNVIFGVRSTSYVAETERAEAVRLINFLAYEVQQQIRASAAELNDRSELRRLLAERKSIDAAVAKAAAAPAPAAPVTPALPIPVPPTE